MAARVYTFPVSKGYSMRGDCDMDGKPIWWVELADGDGIVHQQWQFNERVEALGFLRAKTGGQW